MVAYRENSTGDKRRGVMLIKEAGYTPFRRALAGVLPLCMLAFSACSGGEEAKPPVKGDITLTDGLLTIKGERKMEKEDKKESYHRIERQYGSFSRSLDLKMRVKADAIDANYKDGVLTVILPKAEEKKPKKIEVKN